MRKKKNPKAVLENYSKIFMQIGLVLALFVIYSLLELKTYEKHIEDFTSVVMSEEVEEDVPIIQKFTPPPPPSMPQRAILPEKIVVVDNVQEIEETIIKTTETDEMDAIAEYVAPEEIVEVEEEEIVSENVPFLVIEDVPVYPGCEGNKQELKDCFSRKIQQFFQKKFDPNLASELGLSAGRKRMFVQFKIDKRGKVTDIQTRAPHPLLRKAATNVVASLPKMQPGKQRGRPVGVSYTLPVAFVVK